MPRIIVNEGAGPRSVDLSVSRLVVGGSHDCDVRLRDASAAGTEMVIEATSTGHRVVLLRGTLLLNEEPCEIADLLHNDTLHVGDSLVLYKNLAARRPEPVASAVEEAPAAGLEELPELEEVAELPVLPELEELEPGEEPPAARGAAPMDAIDELLALEPPARPGPPPQ